MLVYTCRYRELSYEGKPIVLSVHAIKRAREREIAFPDQVYTTLHSGSVERFGRHGVRFIRRIKKGTIICIGEDLGHAILIKTVERGH